MHDKKCFGPVVLLTVVLAGLPLFGEKKVIAPPGTAQNFPFSPAIAAGDFVYLSGSVASVPGSTSLPQGIEAQTRQTLDNLGVLLKAAGLDFSDVVSANVFLSDMRYYDGMNTAYRNFFPSSPPARATVEAGIVVQDALLEISMIAARRGVRKAMVAPDGWPTPKPPYSWGVLAGDTLFISGLVGADAVSGIAAGPDITTQTEAACRNLEAVLKAGGMTVNDLAANTVYLADSRDFQKMNEVYRKHFPADPPTRATVQGRLGRPELLVEIQAVAVRSNNRSVVGSQGSAPFSPGIIAGERLFLSGMVGRGPSGYAPGDVAAQTRQTLQNLLDTMAQSGFTPTDIVEAQVFLTDVRNFAAMNEVYRSMVPTPFPARATVASPLMAPEALVEIRFTAAR